MRWVLDPLLHQFRQVYFVNNLMCTVIVTTRYNFYVEANNVTFTTDIDVGFKMVIPNDLFFFFRMLDILSTSDKFRIFDNVVNVI